MVIDCTTAEAVYRHIIPNIPKNDKINNQIKNLKLIPNPQFPKMRELLTKEI